MATDHLALMVGDGKAGAGKEFQVVLICCKDRVVMEAPNLSGCVHRARCQARRAGASSRHIPNLRTKRHRRVQGLQRHHVVQASTAKDRYRAWLDLSSAGGFGLQWQRQLLLGGSGKWLPKANRPLGKWQSSSGALLLINGKSNVSSGNS